MDFVPFNPLEEELVGASTDPSRRPAFYRLLLDSQLFVLTPEPPAKTQTRVLERATTVNLLPLSGPHGLFIPMFTSHERLQEFVNRLGQQLGFLGIAGKDLFPLLAGGTLGAMLNPGALYGKELPLDELRSLADGTIFSMQTWTAKGGEEILIGAPATVPTGVLDTLRRFLDGEPGVQRAWLAQILILARSPDPSLMIAVDCPRAEWSALKGRVGLVARDAALAAGERRAIDLIHFEGAFGGYFEKAAPFFERAAKKPWWKR